VDFVFDSNEIRGLEQNPDTNSVGHKWFGLARKVMHLSRGPLRGERGGREGDSIRQASGDGSMNNGGNYASETGGVRPAKKTMSTVLN